MEEKQRLPLEIQLLGDFAVFVEGIPLPRIRSRVEQWLLAMLVLRSDHDTDRTWFTERLWPDSEDPFNNLRRDLSHLRQALGSQAVRLLSPTRDTLRLDLTGAVVDVLAFDAAIRRGTPAALEQAVALYGGPFLQGLAFPRRRSSSDFVEEEETTAALEEWRDTERTTREQRYLEALVTLAAAALAQGTPTTAIGYLQKLIALEPTRESAWRDLMRAYAEDGDASAVRKTFFDLQQTLRRAFNADPDPATVSLYQQLNQVAPSPSGKSPPFCLPIPLTRLIGREKEMAEVHRLTSLHRLVTITGAGGSGKTRLAIEVAGRTSGEFRDGVGFVDLAPLSEPSLVPQAVATALGMVAEPQRPCLEVLLETLQNQERLLVLDNCEHLASACADLAESLLLRCPGLHLLVTSRQALDRMGEWRWRIPSLALPPEQEAIAYPQNPAAFLEAYSAVQLFAERAEASGANFQLNGENVELVGKICRCLDGIPLAIEVTAARVGSLPLEEVLRRLEEGFRFLAEGRRRSLTRHQTLLASLELSYGLLNPSERLLLLRLSVFAGGWTLAAAEQVCTESLKANFLDLLTSLVDKSLVVAEIQGNSMRYRLLEPIRQFSAEKLSKTLEAERLHGRHRDYFLAFAEEAFPHLRGNERRVWFDRLERDHDNLRTALRWCQVDPEGGEKGVQFAGYLYHFWGHKGYFQEARDYLTAALAHPGATGQTYERARALNSLAGLIQWQGEDSMRPLYEESLSIFRALGDKWQIAVLLGNLGLTASYACDFESARAYFEEALGLQRELGIQDDVALTYANLGNLALRQRNDQVRAWDCYQQGLAVSREAGVRLAESYLLERLGSLACEMHRLEEARAYLEQSLACCREVGGRIYEAYALFDLGKVAQQEGDLAEAKALLQQSLRMLRELGLKRQLLIRLRDFAIFYTMQGQFERAAPLFGAFVSPLHKSGVPMSPSQTAELEQHSALSRTALREEAFDALWGVGQAMTLEEAVAFALEETPASRL